MSHRCLNLVLTWAPELAADTRNASSNTSFGLPGQDSLSPNSDLSGGTHTGGPGVMSFSEFPCNWNRFNE
jgi:hypothetical protein